MIAVLWLIWIGVLWGHYWSGGNYKEIRFPSPFTKELGDFVLKSKIAMQRIVWS